MKIVKTHIGGKDVMLHFNGAAMFELDDEFGQIGKLVEKIDKQNAEGFKATCKAVAILARQAELTRRYFGYEPEEIVTEEAVSLLLNPTEIMNAKAAVMRSIMLGFGREIESEDEEVDVFMMELNQKKTKR